jgi:putative CRISPR-associated protein (TIGR02619 family)
MTRRLISTVGTSLLSNAPRHDFNPHSPDSLHTFLQRCPQEASAESNALSRLAQPGDELVFLHSDTEEGARCSEALTRSFAEQGFRVRGERIVGLSYNEKGFVQYGLQKLVKLLAQEIREAQRAGQLPVINATGGFKAEIAYATAVGLVFGVDVCYIHEKFRDIVTLPATPMGWDYSLFAWYSDFFDWLGTELRPTPDVQARLAGFPEVLQQFLQEEDGYTFLSPLGDAYLEAFRGMLETRRSLKLSASAQRDYASADYTTQGAYRQVLERLRLGGAGDWQRSAETLSGGVSKFPRGHTPHRVFLVERDGALHVLELSGHGNERRYQDLMQSIRWSQYEHGEFTDLP